MRTLLSLVLVLPMLAIAADRDAYHHSINKQATTIDYYEIAYGKKDDKPWPPSDNDLRPWPPSDAPAKRNPKEVMVNKIMDRLHRP